jgi:hypothetical protein
MAMWNGTISTAEELASLARLVREGNDMEGKTIRLAADIAINFANESEDWISIGYDNKPFRGTFDGGGHVVSGIRTRHVGWRGLFGYVGSGGVIKNLGVADSVFEYDFYVGGIAGNNYGVISNCYFSGYVSGIPLGGLVGNNHGAISNCYASGQVYDYDGGFSGVGGLVGINEDGGTVSSSYYNSETSGRSDTGKGEGRTTAQMRDKNTYVGWDFESVWDMDGSVNDGMPFLRKISIF